MHRVRSSVGRRRVAYLVLLSSLVAVLGACAPTTAAPRGAGGAQASAHAACVGNDFVVTVPDRALFEAIAGPRKAQESPTNELSCSEFARVVHLRANGVTDLEGVQYAVNLSTAALRDSPVTDLAPLANLPRLQTLTITGGRLTSLAPLASMPALVSLDLSSSSVTDLTPLAAVTNLVYLNADGNAIADISALENLTALAWLDLSNNLIADVSALGGNRRIETVILNDNRIVDAGPLGGMTQLTRIELANNGLTELGFLASLKPLSVNLSGNRIATVNAVAHNDHFDGSRTLDLRHNCIDLQSTDPFTRDVISTGGRILLEPQRDDCAAEVAASE